MLYLIVTLFIVLIVLVTCYALSNAATEADRYTDLFYEQLEKEIQEAKRKNEI